LALTAMLHHFLQQLQATLSSENSSTTRETLRQQLQQLIAALNTWNSQLNAELNVQQRLIDSMQQLEGRLDELNRANNSTQPHSNNGQQT
jgi:chromosome segregation ATPase